jgi:hypothetical protein
VLLLKSQFTLKFLLPKQANYGIERTVLRIKEVQKYNADCSAGNDVWNHIDCSYKFPAERLFHQHKRDNNSYGYVNCTMHDDPDKSVRQSREERWVLEKQIDIIH